jgi:sec-independent protein translocase protein TatB
MLSIGWPEMMVVAAAALIIVGPRDLPALLRNIGSVAGRVRRMSNEFRSELNKVAALDEVKDIKKSITSPLKQTQAEIEGEFNKIGKSGVSPSGKLKPSDPKSESVYDEIMAQTAPINPPDSDATKASIATAAAKPAAKSAAAKKPAKRAPAKSRTAKAATTKTTAAKKPAARKAAASKPAATKAAPKKPAAAAKATTAKAKPADKPRRAPRKQPAGEA